MPIKVGFFHFVTGYSEPLSALSQELDKHQEKDLQDSLIVLPEAFNLGREFDINPCNKGEHRESPKFDAHTMLQDLQKQALARGVVFVAGLIDEARRNSAYFVSGPCWRLMCHKLNQDSSCEYDACEDNCDGKNPVAVAYSHGEILFGALICLDSFDHHVEERNKYRSQVERANKRRMELQCDVLCVPAYLEDRYIWPPPAWKTRRVILANSRRSLSCHSAIYDQQGKPVKTPADPTNNEVCLTDEAFITAKL